MDCLERADARDRIELDREDTAGEWEGDGLGRRRPTLLIVWSMWGDISGLVSFNRAIVLSAAREMSRRVRKRTSCLKCSASSPCLANISRSSRDICLLTR